MYVNYPYIHLTLLSAFTATYEVWNVQRRSSEWAVPCFLVATYFWLFTQT